MASKLPAQVQKSAGIGNGMRSGIVTATSSGSGYMVNINGAVVGPFACLDNVYPVVNDVVTLFRQDSSWLIIGRANPQPNVWVFPTLLAGWTGYFGLRQVRGIGRSVQVFAQLTAGTKSDGTKIAVFPAGYLPQVSIDLAAACNAMAGANAQSPHWNIDASGNCTIWGLGSASGCGVHTVYALDYALS